MLLEHRGISLRRGSVCCVPPHVKRVRCGVAKRLDEVTDDQFAAAKRIFTEADYLAQAQSSERAEWASKVRRATGSRHHLFWEPSLDPPALLAQVAVVLVSPRRPVSVGTVARACSCFEVEELRIVQPRTNYITKHGRSASKGAQYIIHRARSYASVADAVAGFDLSIAFTRWVAGRPNFYDLPALTQHPIIQQLVRQAAAAGPAAPPPAFTETPPPEASPAHMHMGSNESGAQAQPAAHQAAPAPASATARQAGEGPLTAAGGSRPVRIALVFGREELGMSDEEVGACDVVCSIPIGRLQESLSVSHAVSLALSQLYSARLAHVAAGTGDSRGSSNAYMVRSPEGLAAGLDASGKEI